MSFFTDDDDDDDEELEYCGDDIHGFRFFKIILEEAIADKRLRLPRRFARQYGGVLEGKAALLDANGLKWDMEIVMDDESCWFQNGWGEFAEFYSLAHGDFVVFECTGGCWDGDESSSLEFSVIVFDGETEMEKETSSQVMSALDVDMFMLNSIHPCFKHEVTAAYFRLKKMPIPQEFFESYMGRVDDMNGLIKLGCGGKLWDVQITRHGPRNGYRRFGFNDWKMFVEDNSVKEGDVCVFQMIDDHELLLHVHIFRGEN